MSISYSGKIESIQDVLTIIDKAGIYTSPHSYLRNWFRGQTRQFDLQPGVYRKDFNVSSEEERLRRKNNIYPKTLEFSQQVYLKTQLQM